MKPTRALLTFPCSFRFPRQSRRGLIETCDSGGISPCGGPVFPGNRAGASLKPDDPAGLLLDVLVFPGNRAGASLKQAEYGIRVESHRVVFPGNRAGASLKQRGASKEAPTLLFVFPGNRAGASLKHLNRDAPDDSRSCFPRQSRRGLIETRLGCRRVGQCFGSFPRQSRRGLIETMKVFRISSSEHFVFPGNRAGASLKRGITAQGLFNTIEDTFPRQSRRGLIETGTGPA